MSEKLSVFTCETILIRFQKTIQNVSSSIDFFCHFLKISGDSSQPTVTSADQITYR